MRIYLLICIIEYDLKHSTCLAPPEILASVDHCCMYFLLKYNTYVNRNIRKYYKG